MASMNQLIPIVNKLQDVFHSVGMLDTIDLPQIAVIGSQSSGKSSVLENIVGRDFLPRGTGIVTRRPLVLQLIHTSEGSEEYGEFLHQPKRKYTDFEEIKNEIQAETERVTGKEGKSISALPIHLKIHSPHVLNLTLIDLPGITKVPVGNQPKDIEYQIKQMLLQYIKKPNCIILAVSPANADIANSEALKLARAVDKSGDRTVGVLTKMDLMDKGTDAMDTINGRVVPLKLGFVGVVLRGQHDIETKKRIQDALETETEFFKNHPSYRPIAHKMGIPYLTKKLNNILLEHIRKCLPEIRNKISSLIAKAQQRLSEYGVPLEESEMNHGALLLQLLTQFSKEFGDVIEGANADLTTDDLFGGARINHIFTEKFYPLLERMDACEGLSDYDIKTAIRNAKGPRTSLFIPEASFVMLVKKQVKKLEDPSLRCVNQVFEELVAIVDHAEKHLIRFPKLRDRTKEFVVELIRRYEGPLKTFIKNLIQIELAYVNTNHPDFFNGGNSSFMLMSQQFQSSMNGPPQQKGNAQGPPVPQRRSAQAGGSLPQQQNEPRFFSQHKTHHSSSQSPAPSTATPVVEEEEEVEGDWYKIPTYPRPDQRKKKRSSFKKTASSSKKFLQNFFGHGKESSSSDESDNASDVDPLTGEPVQSQERKREPRASSRQSYREEQYQRAHRQQTQRQQYQQAPTQQYTENTEQNTNTIQQDPYSYNPPQQSQGGMTDREQRETEIIKNLLTEYFKIVRKNISDAVPKSIMHFMVNMTKLNLQSELVQNLYKSELFEELLQENDEIAQKRKATQKMLTILLRAQDIINEVRDLKV